MVGEVPYLTGVDTLVEVLRHLRHSAKRLGVQLELVDDLLAHGARELVHRTCRWLNVYGFPHWSYALPKERCRQTVYKIWSRFFAALRAAFAAALPALRRASKSSKSTTGVMSSNTTAAAKTAAGMTTQRCVLSHGS